MFKLLVKVFSYSLLFILIFVNSSYAIDYLYESVQAYQQCVQNGTKCDLAKKYINEGINYYTPRRHNSYDALQTYCGLIYLRLCANAWGNKEIWNRDVYMINKECRCMGGY